MMGLAFSYYQKKGNVAVDARLPHPFHFTRPRTVSGQAPGLKREELGVHLQAMWFVPIGDGVDVALFGGPSYFNVKQTLVKTVTFTEAFPYDTATFTGIATEIRKRGAFGFNAGADLTWLLSDQIGIGGGARFSRGTVKFTSSDGDRLSADVGGAQAVAGLRVRW